jgi:enamine deaminase RidA (YjgF/YER057c/UK114 family)
MNDNEIIRHGVTVRWSDAVVHRGVVYFVEVPDDVSIEAPCQFAQVLEQVDKRLAEVGSDRNHLLQVIVYLPEPKDLMPFNELWDAWVPKGHAPSRACIHAPLAAKEYRVELVVTAATAALSRRDDGRGSV